MQLNKEDKITSLGTFKEIKEQVVILSGVGKSRGLIGQRVSFAHVPDKIVQNLSSCLTGDISRDAQTQAAVALQDTPENEEYLKDCREEYKSKIVMVKKKIDNINKTLSHHFHSSQDIKYLEVLLEPKAASMMMLSFKNLKGKIVEKRNKRTKLETGLDVAYYLLDNVGVALSPGESFFMNDGDMALRLPLGYPKEEIEKGMEQINFSLQKLKSDDNPPISHYAATEFNRLKLPDNKKLVRSHSL